MMTDYINKMRSIKNKKIYFDLLLIKILDILSNTNVRNNDIKTVVETKITTEDNKKIEEFKTVKTVVNKEEPQDSKYEIYKELMDVRLNNILADADKESLKEYLDFKEHLEEQLDNLDERKNFNLLSDCTIKAGSKDGIIITSSNMNILNELYDDLLNLEQFFNNKLSKEIKVCFYDDSLWEDKRKIYVNKIKNKEKIDILDENDIYNKIKESKSEKKSDFDDLLEIGE